MKISEWVKSWHSDLSDDTKRQTFFAMLKEHLHPVVAQIDPDLNNRMGDHFNAAQGGDQEALDAHKDMMEKEVLPAVESRLSEDQNEVLGSSMAAQADSRLRDAKEEDHPTEAVPAETQDILDGKQSGEFPFHRLDDGDPGDANKAVQANVESGAISQAMVTEATPPKPEPEAADEPVEAAEAPAAEPAETPAEQLPPEGSNPQVNPQAQA